jgi:hypothetical protein
VLDCIAETFSDSDVVKSIEEKLRSLLESLPNQTEQDVEEINSLLDNNRKRQQNLTEALEVNGDHQGIVSIVTRLKELEREEELLKKRLCALEADLQKPIDLQDVGKVVAEFMLNFRERFLKAPIEEQKSLIKKCISGIVVEKEKAEVFVFVRTPPAVTPELESFYPNKKALTEVVSAVRSGDRT